MTRPPSRAVDVRRADGWLDPEYLTVEVAMALEELQPFGVGNPEPVWAARGLLVQNHRVVGEKHLKMTLRFPDDRLIDGIAFGLAGEPLPKEPLDMLFQLQNNVWNNVARPQLMVQDWRVSTHPLVQPTPQNTNSSTTS
jgi:single-stranded-DNA-specific exonuclease